MPLFVADYLADTAHLTATQHGAYMLMIMNYWQRGAPLPDDDFRLAKIARVGHREWLRMRDTLSEFFSIADGAWRHGRIDAELARVEHKSLQAKKAGQSSAKRRLNGRSTDVQPTEAQAEQNITDTEQQQQQQAAAAVPTPDDFLSAWNESVPFAPIEQMTPPRIAALRDRLKDMAWRTKWRAALARVRGSPFMSGGGEKGWKAHVDWFLKPEVVTLILEGKYDAVAKRSTANGRSAARLEAPAGKYDNLPHFGEDEHPQTVGFPGR